MSRNLKLEQDYIRTSKKLVNLEGETAFEEHVKERLVQGDKNFGDTFRERSVTNLLEEAIEEAPDAAAWLLLAFQQIIACPDASEEDMDAIGAMLPAISHLLLAYRILTEQRELYRERHARIAA